MRNSQDPFEPIEAALQTFCCFAVVVVVSLGLGFSGYALPPMSGGGGAALY